MRTRTVIDINIGWGAQSAPMISDNCTIPIEREMLFGATRFCDFELKTVARTANAQVPVEALCERGNCTCAIWRF